MRTFDHRDFPLGRVLAAKAGHCVTVCLPAKDEAATVGTIVGALCDELGGPGVIDEVIVVDDGSEDGTGDVASSAGATVVRPPGGRGGPGSGGKGQAMQHGLALAKGDIVVYCDADLADFGVHFVLGLIGPLLEHDELAMVKGCYQRPFAELPGEGGRVTELVARPLIALFHPHLASVAQPIGGEIAARREVLEQVPFAAGYGVDIALLIDVAQAFGVESVAQCDLGARHHRHRPLDQLGAQAVAVAHSALRRAGISLEAETVLRLPSGKAIQVVSGDSPPLAGRDRPDPIGGEDRTGGGAGLDQVGL